MVFSSSIKPQDQVLRVADVCNLLKINRMTFYDLKKKGLLTVMDINKGANKRPRYRVTLAALHEYMQKQKVT